MERYNSVMARWFSSIYVGSGKGNCLILVRPPPCSLVLREIDG